MKIEELEVGDIVLDNKHSGIYVGLRDGKHCIVHALSGGFNGANVRCTSFETFFKACNTDQINVFRTKDSILAKKASEYAYQFGINKDLPFDDFRLIQANVFSDKLKQAEQKYATNSVNLLHETFMISGLFRAIKFASRRDINLLKAPDKSKPNHGLRCAFFVCLCYQIAGLAGFVKPLSPDNKLWPSNKHCDKNQLQLAMHGTCQRYLNYLSQPKVDIVEGKLIQKEQMPASPSELPKNPNSRLKRITETNHANNYLPAIFQWLGKESLDDPNAILKLATHITRAMMVDAKYCTAKNLCDLLADDKAAWTHIGQLNPFYEQENRAQSLLA